MADFEIEAIMCDSINSKQMLSIDPKTGFCKRLFDQLNKKEVFTILSETIN